MTGSRDGLILHMIGEAYRNGRVCSTDYLKAMEYYHHAIDVGYVPAYVGKSELLWQGGNGIAVDRDKSLLLLVEAEEKAVGVKDDLIIKEIFVRLSIHHDFKPETLGRFRNKGEMSLHYCDILIERGSPSGYYFKGSLYAYGRDGLPEDEAKAVSIWEEADRVGLADYRIYSRLQYTLG